MQRTELELLDLALCEVCGTIGTAYTVDSESRINLCVNCNAHGENVRILESNRDYFTMQDAAAARLSTIETRVVTLSGIDFHVNRTPKVVVLELTDDCDLTCSTCIAGSFSGAGNYKSLVDLQKMMKFARAESDASTSLMISGGEPTMHPDLEQVIESAYGLGFQSVILISNGKRLADENGFARRLKRNFPDLEIFLQFDSTNPEVLTEIRGTDLSMLRASALHSLAEAELFTTLVCVVTSGLSTREIGAVIEEFSVVPTVRGINLQPLRVSGRHENENLGVDCAPSTGELASELESQVQFVKSGDIVPHPVSPWIVSCGYWDRARNFASQTELVIREFSPPSSMPLFAHPETGGQDLFRIAIVTYLDQFCLRNSVTSTDPIFIVTKNLHLVPLDLYYMFGEPSGVQLALPIRRAR
ncbi:MAG: radical SAM protein [Acidimicrobiales bacterium]